MAAALSIICVSMAQFTQGLGGGFYIAQRRFSCHLRTEFHITAEDLHVIYKMIGDMTHLVANCS